MGPRDGTRAWAGVCASAWLLGSGVASVGQDSPIIPPGREPGDDPFRAEPEPGDATDREPGGTEPPAPEDAAPAGPFLLRSLRVDEPGSEGVGGAVSRVWSGVLFPEAAARPSLRSRAILVRPGPDGVLTLARDEERADPAVRSLSLGSLIDGRRTAVLVDGAVVRGLANEVFLAWREAGFIAVRVEVPGESLPALSAEGGSGELVLRVRRAVVESVRAVSVGRTHEAGAGALERIASGSPTATGLPVRGDLINAYTRGISRYGRRSVSATVLAGETADGVVIEYGVDQSKPWTAFFQVSNTGTEATDEYRQRFGLVHANLTGVGDLLSIDYVTGGFDSVDAVVASYERPLLDVYGGMFGGLPRLRGRIFGSWSEYTATDVGLVDVEIDGESWSAGGEVIWNIAAFGSWFIDLHAGGRLERTEVDNATLASKGETGFFIGDIGVRAERQTVAATTRISLSLDRNFSAIGNTDASELDALGRLGASDEWSSFKYAASQSVYLEPLLDRRWGSEGARLNTYAHEVFVSLRGQVVLENERVPATFTEVVGGFSSVRGYPESYASGDNALIATGEYRLHLPRLFPAGEPSFEGWRGEPFRLRPDRRPGVTDWDLVARAFVDVGRVTNNNGFDFERDNTLVGAGVGAELSVRDNVTLRLDWGVAMDGADNGSDPVDEGDARLHFLLTLAY